MSRRATLDSYARIYNYNANAGAGSDVITAIADSSGWRAALLGTVAAGAFLVSTPRLAKAGPAPCVSSLVTATCTGNQSAGIKSGTDFPNTVTTLQVNSLTTNIAPGVPGVDGIYFHGATTVNIISDTTPFRIIPTGADGIDAYAYGAVKINHTGDIGASAGRDGINAKSGGSSLVISSYGNIEAAIDGIYAQGVAGVTIMTGKSNISVTGGAARDGIHANNSDSGDLTITANGDITSTRNDGIYARNFGGNLSVTSAGVTGRAYGIFAHNYGSGALDIAATGDVVGTTGDGIYALNSYGTHLSITSAGVTGGTRGIDARNYGSSALSITANGDVTGGFAGIEAQNGNGFLGVFTGTDLTVITGASTTVTGGFVGLRAFNYGSGALTIRVNGDVTGSTGIATGIAALNYGTTLTVTTAAGTTVSGKGIGISAINYGGALALTINGDVTGGADDGIYACHGVGARTCGTGGGPIAITIGSASHVTSNGAGADDFAIDIEGDPGDVTVAGTLNGGAGGAIQFDQGAALNDRLELQPGAVVNGKVFAGPGTDTFVLGGEGEASFGVGTIGPGLQYQSFETFLKEDESHWTLTGTNTGITAWAVTGGILSVNGFMPNTLFTVSGATLGGSGTIGGFTGIGGLILAPGNSIGTLTSNGNAVFGPTSTFEVEANAAGEADKLVVKGTVNLTGSVLRVLAEAGSYKPKTEYLIIDNDGGDAVVGKFAEITASLAFLTPVVIYNGGDGNDVVLTLLTKCPTPPTPPKPPKPPTPGPLATFCSAAKTHNQRAVAKALSLFATDNPLFLAVLNLPSADSARQAFDALSGEIHATLPGVLADESRYVRDAILGRLTQATYTNSAGQFASLGAGGPQVVSLNSQAMALGYDNKSLGDAPHAYDSGIAFWTNAYGAWGNFDGNRNAATADRNLGGFVSGMDALVTGSWRLGVATGFSQSAISVDKRHSAADVQSVDLAGYAGGMAGPLALRGGGVWAWQNIDTSRAVTFPGFFEREKASYDADTGQIFGEVAYPTSTRSIALEPFAGLAYVQVSTSSFKEHGGELSALRSRNIDENVGYSTLGLRFGTIWHWNEMVLVPHASAAWQHAFNDVTPGAALAFASTGIGLGITGVPLAESSALIEAGLDLNLSPTATIGVSYSGQLASDLMDNSVKGRFTWVF